MKERIRTYSATICGADGEEKVEFPNICGENLSKLVDVCLSVGLPVLIEMKMNEANYQARGAGAIPFPRCLG